MPGDLERSSINKNLRSIKELLTGVLYKLENEAAITFCTQKLNVDNVMNKTNSFKLHY
uniref:Uncharacterized protein n=1 Tax=Arundo donax TaxID=35708 RepID=A0A0A9C0F4_ARUDO